MHPQSDSGQGSIETYLAMLEWEAAVRRDDRMTGAEQAAACQALAECCGVAWRTEWVVRP